MCMCNDILDKAEELGVDIIGLSGLITPSLDEIRNRVRLEWIDQEEESRLQQEVDRLWEKYSLKILGDRTEH